MTHSASDSGVKAAAGKPCKLEALDWIIVFINGHYVAFVRDGGPRKEGIIGAKLEAPLGEKGHWVNLDSMRPSM